MDDIENTDSFDMDGEPSMYEAIAVESGPSNHNYADNQQLDGMHHHNHHVDSQQQQMAAEGAGFGGIGNANGSGVNGNVNPVVEIDEEPDASLYEIANRNLVASSHTDQLERCGRWLLSIPRDDLIALRQTQEYHDFLKAFERLGHVHRRDIARNRPNFIALEKVTPSSSNEDSSTAHIVSNTNNSSSANSASNGSSTASRRQMPVLNYSFLQHMAADDIVLRVLEFLECQVLIKISSTCFRFRELAHRSATQRTYDVANARQLNNVMKLLRAKEQIDGVGTGITDSHVRVPILLLSRRVLVTDAGDPEYNGVYFCTGSNGNGFVFTKPRYPEQRVQRNERRAPREAESLPDAAMFEEAPAPPADTHRLESEVAQPGQLLRCIIAKRFSNETILWYLSKEVIAMEDTESARAGEVTQVFAFWAKLMVIGDASPDICRYPSQSSILSRHQEGWQALATTRTANPPTVELLD